MYGSGIEGGFGDIFVACLIIGAAFVGAIWGCIELFSDDSIRSDQPIKPKIELVIKDNKVDTIYIYKKP